MLKGVYEETLTDPNFQLVLVSQTMRGKVVQNSITQIWFQIYCTNPITIIFITLLTRLIQVCICQFV